MVDTYRRIVAGFFPADRQSNTNSRTVFADAGNASTRNPRQNPPKITQSALHALKVLAENAPAAIDDQSARRSAVARAPEVEVVSDEFMMFGVG
jgi:hypothetical protein